MNLLLNSFTIRMCIFHTLSFLSIVFFPSLSQRRAEAAKKNISEVEGVRLMSKLNRKKYKTEKEEGG